MTPSSHQVLFQNLERWYAWMKVCRQHSNGEAPALVQTRIVTHDPQIMMQRSAA